MRTDKFFNDVCGKINEIDKLLQVTISWSRVMQLNPDTTINGENGETLHKKWESLAQGINDLVIDINSLGIIEKKQVADVIIELKQKFTKIERKENSPITDYEILRTKEIPSASKDEEERKVYYTKTKTSRKSNYHWTKFILYYMQLVIDTLYETQRSRYSAHTLPTAEEPLPPTEEDETPILRSLIGKETDKYLRFCQEEKYQGHGQQLILQDGKKIRLLTYIREGKRKSEKVKEDLRENKHYQFELFDELIQIGAIKCGKSCFNDNLDGEPDKYLKQAWDSFD